MSILKKSIGFGALVLLSIPSFAAWQARGVQYKDVVNVRVSDVVKFHSDIDSNLSLFSEWAQDNEKELLASMGDVKIKKVHNLFLTDFPKRDGDQYKYEVTAFVEIDSTESQLKDESYEGFYFVMLTVSGSELERKGSKVKGEVSVLQKRQIGLKETSLSVEVALASRKAIIKDASLPIKMVFPLGVGAFDENVLNDGMSIITPRFKDGVLDKRYAMYSREMPRYYMKKPFIRLLSSEDPKTGFTGIGFHAQPNGDEFIRAFDSHGCMRMQDDDLYTMYWVVTQNATGKTPIVVNFNSSDSSEHPFPKKDKPYKTVLNTGKNGNPDFTLDIDDLVQLTSNYKSSAPVSELKDDDNDDVNVIFDYEMAWRVKEKREGKVAACKERYKLDLSEFTVDRSEFSVNRADYFTSWMSEKEKARAQKEYDKAVKNADKEYSRAVKDVQKAKEAAIKENKQDLEDCLKNIRKKRTLKEKLYRWWVHGKKSA